MTAPDLLGIDLGTSSVKVGAFAADGEMLSFVRRRHPFESPSGDVVDADPEAWWSATAAALRQVGSEVDLRHVRALCVGGQGPTLVLVDGHGRPVRPALTWMDTRSAPQAARLAERLGSDRAAYSLVPKLLWVADKDPRSFERARWALQAWDFLGGRLAGGHTGAASTFAGDEVWRRDWLEAAGLADRSLIPPLVVAGHAYAETGGGWSEEAGLPDGIPIVGGMNDGLGSIVGAAGSMVGRATDPGGAAGGLAVCAAHSVSGPGIDCWPGLVPNTFIIGGAFVAGGRALDWWAAATADADLERTLALAAEAPPGAGGLVCLPFLAGERAPIWDPSARGALIGLTFDHGPAHLARAILEGTAYELRLLSDAVIEAGAPIDELRVCGGQARSQLWNQVKADVTGLPASVPRLPEVALMGDAICAAVGAGFYPDLSTAGETMVHVGQVLQPNPANRDVYDELFAVYRAAYPALRPFFPNLARAAGHTPVYT